MNATAFVCALLLALCIGPAAVYSEDTPSKSFARIQVGDARLELERNGQFSLVLGDKTLISRARILVAGVGWRGTGSQSGSRMLQGYPKTEGDTFVFKGDILEKASGTTWRFEQRVTPVANGVHVAYQIEPLTDTKVAEVSLFMHFPIAQWRGRHVLLWPTAQAVFPAEKPRNRHFFSGAARKVVLGEPDTGQMSIDFSRPVFCSLQDARDFNEQAYHIYPKLFGGGDARAGQSYGFAFTLIPDDEKEHGMVGITLQSEGRPRISNVTVNRKTVPQYEKFEIRFDVSGTWDNPFDPSQVAVDCVFRMPGGPSLTMPGFFAQDYERFVEGGSEMLIPIGRPTWKVRFAPPVPGTYRYRLQVTNSGKTVRTRGRTFRCRANREAHGFLRVSTDNPRYLQFDDGTPFFAVGMNIATLGSGRTLSAERWYTRLAEVGGNLVRSWWCSGGTDIESRVTNRPDQGLGKYKLDEAWRIDYTVDLAERLGIHIMCCFETQQYLRREKTWPRFTYNAANGGPVTSPADYFVNDKADEYFRRRLRYIVARWSYSTAIYAWQFWNEVSACNDFKVDNAARWHKRMATYLREIDPFDHIIHTNFGNLDGYTQIDGLPEMEVVSTNIYSRRDMAQTGAWGTAWMAGRYPGKPFFLTEYGVGHKGGWIGEDPTGVIVHNGLWGPVMCGSAGTGLPWGWGSWIDPQDMYHYWKPISEVVRDIPFCKRRWQAVKVESLTYKDGAKQPYYAGVFFEGWPRNYAYNTCEDPLPETFHITPEGEVVEQGSLKGFLWQSASQTFVIDFPVDGTLVVHVPEIWTDGHPVLLVDIDGKEALRQKLPRDTERPWEYWKSFPVPVGAGEHTIKIANAGSGSLWTGYELQNYRYREGPDLDVVGMYTDDYILLWARNPQFIWIYAREGRELEEQDEGLLTLKNVRDGRYSVVWRETTTGEILAETDVKASGGKVTLATPKITRSAVAKLVKLK